MKKAILAILITASSLLVGCGQTDNNVNTDKAQSEAPTVAHGHDATDKNDAHANVKPSFDISITDYGNKVSELLAGTDFEGETLTQVVEGESDNVFISDYSYKISMVGESSETDKLQKLTYTMPFDDTISEEAARLTQLVAASAQSLNSKLSQKEASARVSDLINEAVSGFVMQKEPQRTVIVINDQVYVCDVSEMGVRLLIEPANGSRYI
ncbi:hypothetical protein [Psychrobacter lutiphocae]|uniref:hypothetical protein n=1 Tax=Psychrobacter lutiphocae TaxID=540500 RepID=UPI00035F5AC4|nr:hypothetical protein [Psychrobacter lutiphocae]